MKLKKFTILFFLVLIANKIYASETYIYPFTPFGSAKNYISSHKRLHLDSNKIPYFDYGTEYDNVGKRYNPGFIAAYAQALYRDYEEKNTKELKKEFLKITDWLLTNAKKRKYLDKEFFVWEYDFDMPKFKAKAPWISAYTNGKILPVMGYAYKLTKKHKYKKALDLTFNSFLVPMHQGGVVNIENENEIWLEEYAKEDIPSSKVLNGQIFAMAGLYTIYKNFHDEKVYSIFLKAYTTVLNSLEIYDGKVLSYYSQYPNKPKLFAPIRGYNSLHIRQLLWLYKIKPNAKILKFALKFAFYENTLFKYSASHSIDPKNHGPEMLRMYLDSHYWSASEFPVEVKVNLLNRLKVKGLKIIKHTKETDPEKFNIYLKNDNNISKVINYTQDSNKKTISVTFSTPIYTDNLYIKFNSTNNKILALNGIGIVTELPNPTAVFNFKNYRNSNKLANFFTEGYKINNKIIIIIDKVMFENLNLDFSCTSNIDLKINGSNTLEDFTSINYKKVNNNEIKIKSNFRYIKIIINSTPRQILKAKYN